MLDVEVLGAGLDPLAPSAEEIRELCQRVATRLGLSEGHVAVEFVEAERITQLNAVYRGKPAPTDVLSFPIDLAPSADASADQRAADMVNRHPPVELGDVIICPEHTVDLRQAVIHGMLHVMGMDHETDDGQMLALERELLAGAEY